MSLMSLKKYQAPGQRFTLAFSSFVLLSASPLSAQDASALYSGKTIRIIVGTSSGGGFDASGRVLEQLLPNHLPGHPQVVVQNMPGGSSLKAANYLYNAAPGDGTYLGIFNHSLILQTIADPKSTQFEMSKFQWIGRVAIDDLIGVVWRSAGVINLDDATRKQVVIGSSSANSSSSMVPYALNHLFGTKFKVVTGYPGMMERYVAMERNEIDGIAGASWSFIHKSRPDWVSQNRIVVLHQNSLERAPDLADVPTLVELGKTDEDRKILSLLGLTETVGKSVTFGPNVAPEFVKAMRDGFQATTADPQFRQLAERLGIMAAPMTGEKIQARFDDAKAVMTRAFIERFRQVTAE